MKYYIFLTSDISLMGGMQSYVSTKSRYLKKDGWIVKMFFPGVFKDNYAFYRDLNEFMCGGNWYIKFPPCAFDQNTINKVLDHIILLAGCNISDEIIIESHNDTFSLWGELLAQKLECKNFGFLCNELFSGDGKYYDQYIDFFLFKFSRRELAFISTEAVEALLGKELEVLDKENYVLTAHNDIMIENVHCEKLDNINKDKINICYFGRLDKGYLPQICDNVLEYVSSKPDSNFRFLIVGNGNDNKANSILRKRISNLEVCKLGAFTPIPQKLFEISDVVIASSGCAHIAYSANKKVIVPNSDTGEALGILGYTTKSAIYGDKKYDYKTLFDEILFEHKYEGKAPLFIPIKDRKYNYDFNIHFKYIDRSTQKKEYFNLLELGKTRLSKKAKLQVMLLNKFGNSAYSQLFSIWNHLKK